MLKTSSSISRGEYAVQNGAADADRLTDVPVHQVDHVCRVVVQASAALGALAAPGPALGLEHHRSICLAEDVGHLADGSGVEQGLYLAEGTDESVVIADLRDEPSLAPSAVSSSASATLSVNGFSQKTCRPLFQSGARPLGVRARRCGDHDRVQVDFPRASRRSRCRSRLRCTS